MDELPRFVRDLIASFPEAGDGVHRHLFRLARYLHALHSEQDIFALLRAASNGCGRRVTDREIRDAILNSEPVAWRPREQAQAFGHDASKLRLAITMHAFVARTSQEAVDTFYPYYASYMSCMPRSRGVMGRTDFERARELDLI